VGIIIFAAVWVLILAVPKTRGILRSQIEESKSQQQYLFLPFGNNALNISDAQKYMKSSNDPAVKMTLLLNQQTTHIFTTRTEAIKQYDNLLKQYPKNLWLIKKRLIASISYGFKLPMDSTFRKRIYPDYMPNISKAENQQFQREIPRALQIALYGEKLDPENSFFNWMQASLLFAQDKPEFALQALEKGARKKYFDDGFGGSRKASIIAAEITGRNLFEERFLANYSVFLEDMPILTETNMAAVSRGALAEHHGDQQQALKIYGAQLQLCQQVLAYTQKFGYSGVANNLAINAWLSKKRFPAWSKQRPKTSSRGGMPHLEMRKWYAWRTTVAADLFANYAATNHRPDLSVMAKKLGNTFFVATDQPLHAQTDEEVNALFGKFQMQLLFQLKWIGMQLFKCLELFVPLFLLISLPVLITLQKYPNIRATLNQQINIVNVVAGTLFTLCVFGFLLTFALSQGVSSYYYDNFSNNFGSAKMDHINILRGYIRMYYWWIPFAACYIYCSISTLWKCRKSTFVNETQRALTISIGVEKLEKISKRISIAHQIIWWIVVALLELFWFGWIVTTNVSYILIPLTLIISAVIWWFAKNIHLPAPTVFTGTYWLLFATWMQRSLALLILIFTLAYGVTSWASLPLRHNANTQLDHVLKVGEVTALREVLQRDKAQNPDVNAVE